jgi:hypothetical protein
MTQLKKKIDLKIKRQKNKRMLDYSKGKIYKLWSPSKNLVYYGSTIQTLSQRLAKHKNHYKTYKNDDVNKISAHLILECEDYKIELLEEYPCNNKSQLDKREGEYQKNNECVNCYIAGRTLKELYQDNKEEKKNKANEYRKNNLEKRRDYDKQRYQNEERKKSMKENQKRYRDKKKQEKLNAEK